VFLPSRITIAAFGKDVFIAIIFQGPGRLFFQFADDFNGKYGICNFRQYSGLVTGSGSNFQDFFMTFKA
jgi:hypothetical protein